MNFLLKLRVNQEYFYFKQVERFSKTLIRLSNSKFHSTLRVFLVEQDLLEHDGCIAYRKLDCSVRVGS